MISGRLSVNTVKKAGLLLAVLVLINMLVLPSAASDVCLSSQSLRVNGRDVVCQAYNIDGSNYFKLRDLALLLTDTGSRFSVSYDEAEQTVLLTSGISYEPIGGELSDGEDLSATAQSSRQRIIINGEARDDLSVYNIGGEAGSNYFRLRDLGEALGFHVNYDESTRTVLLRSRFDPGQARLTETEDAGREYLDKIVFLGDSTTYGIGYYYRHGYTDLVPPAQVWTPSNGTMTLSYYATTLIVYPETKENLTIFEAARRARPEILVITLGVNGISFMDEDWFTGDYRDLVSGIREVSPATEIILNAIYPVADSWEGQSYINNERIDRANGWIESLAEELGCPFLFAREALETDGKLPENRQNGDGLHLTGEAFGLVMEYIRTHALPVG